MRTHYSPSWMNQRVMDAIEVNMAVPKDEPGEKIELNYQNSTGFGERVDPATLAQLAGS